MHPGSNSGTQTTLFSSAISVHMLFLHDMAVPALKPSVNQWNIQVWGL